MSSRFLCLDLGTTGLKASVLTDRGEEIAAASRGYPIAAPRPGWAEQDPEDWWRALVDCCDEVRTRVPDCMVGVVGIGICGQMHTHVYLGADGAPLRPAITWMDQRSGELLARMGGDASFAQEVFGRALNAPAATYTAPNCAWVKEAEPEVWRKTTRVLLAKDYLKYRLTGEMVTDYSDAAGTLLLDVAGRRWSDELLAAFGIPRGVLPELGGSSSVAGRLSRAAADILGLPSGTPVNNGSSDNSAAAFGSDMVAPGQVTLIIGTAGVVSACADRPIPDPRHRLACWNYCLEDRWISLGVTQTAGESLNWFRRCFDPSAVGEGARDAFEEYEKIASRAPAGSGGLVFLPYLNGERTPYWDSHARGVFFGIGLETEKRHFVRAVMEGVSFALRNCLETSESLGLKVDEVRAIGGGLKSRAWLECLSGILGRPLRTLAAADPGNRGNAMLCGMALGLFGSAGEALGAFGGGGPGDLVAAERAEAYEENYRIFKRLYVDLKSTFRGAAA